MSTAATAQPLAEHVYQAMTDDIIAGRLSPGTPLGQEALAERFSVSRTPVRDALTRLATDGLVHLVPAKGYFVNDLSRNDVRDVFDVRYALESLGLREAVPNHSLRTLRALEELSARTRDAADDPDADIFEPTLQFHRELILPCGNAYLLEVLGGVWGSPVQRRISMSSRPSPARIRKIADDHTAIVACVRADDVDGALAVLRECHTIDTARQPFPDPVDVTSLN